VYVLQCLKEKVPVDAPDITYKWLKNWRMEFNVSLRYPNRRWKVPRPVLKERLHIMWTNLIRVQVLLWLHFGQFADVDGFDQKPLHTHESGSKHLKTLAFRGEEEIPVKEGHSATRSRWTVVTYVTSNKERALLIPPLELCFKGGSGVHSALAGLLEEFRAEGLDVGWLTMVATESGSYKTGDVFRYLESVLEERV